VRKILRIILIVLFISMPAWGEWLEDYGIYVYPVAEQSEISRLYTGPIIDPGKFQYGLKAEYRDYSLSFLLGRRIDVYEGESVGGVRFDTVWLKYSKRF